MGAPGGAIVGLGVGVMSADAKFADTTPIPAPSASTPEAIATAVFVEGDTSFVAPCRRLPSVLPKRVKRRPVNYLGGTWQPASSMSRDDVEPSLAVRFPRVERELEQHDSIEEAVLTLATPDEASLIP